MTPACGAAKQAGHPAPTSKSYQKASLAVTTRGTTCKVRGRPLVRDDDATVCGMARQKDADSRFVRHCQNVHLTELGTAAGLNMQTKLVMCMSGALPS